MIEVVSRSFRSRQVRGQLQQRVPGLAKWCPSEHSLKHFEAVWSTLKQFEIVWTVGAGTVWSSLKLTGAKHSITWHNFEASRRRDSTSACLVSTSSTCPIVTARITLWNSYVAKNRICKCQKNMLTTSCNSPLSKSWGQLNFNKESSNQIWFKPY